MLDAPDMTPVCEDCGTVAPVIKEMSSQNWKVYRTNEPCKCGGKFVPKFTLEKLGAEEPVWEWRDEWNVL